MNVKWSGIDVTVKWSGVLNPGWNPYSCLTLLMLQRVYRTCSLPWSAQRRTSLRHDCQPYRRAHLSRPLSLLLQHSPTLWQLPRRPHLSTGTTSEPAATARRRHWWHCTHLLASASFSSTRLYSDIFWDFLVCITMPPRTYSFSTEANVKFINIVDAMLKNYHLKKELSNNKHEPFES